jgi:hypothetical protein
MQQFRPPSGTRDARAFDDAIKRVLAELAGRTVWIGARRAGAHELPGHLEWAVDDGVAARWLEAGDDVRQGDIVVLHDPVTTAPADAIRQLGAHVICHVLGLREPAPAVDAYVVSGATPDGTQVVAALLPCSGIVTAKQMRGRRYRDAGWSSLLADIVAGDREECVGGTLHPRPAVAAR